MKKLISYFKKQNIVVRVCLVVIVFCMLYLLMLELAYWLGYFSGSFG